MLKELTKDKQIFMNKLYSDDMLIRSMKESLKNVLPYLPHLDPFLKENDLWEV